MPTLEEYNKWRVKKGMYPAIPKIGEKAVRTVYLSNAAHNRLVQLANYYNLVGQRGNKQPSISTLIEAIGLGVLDTQWSTDWEVFDDQTLTKSYPPPVDLSE